MASFAHTSAATPAERAGQLAADGAPLIGVRLNVDPNGEVRARTAKTMAGYWRQPELSSDAFDGEWLMTGDGGEFKDGVLHVTDRKKDVIVTGGENVSSLQCPTSIEQRDSLPRTATGKTQKYLLREPYWP